MLEVKPFAAIRFDSTRLGGDLSAVLAPPYDVLDQASKEALTARHERNIVLVDLPHLPPKAAGPAEVYQRSARRLDQWLGEGTLIREARPALYVYHQRFEHDGQVRIRRMFIARVRLQPFSNGSILPHEQTFGGPKADRLALMKATRCQLSPIFGLYRDAEDRIGAAFAATVAAAPDVTGTLEGVENRMWIVTDTGVIDQVVSVMAERKIYIADGHHRYGTALLYRDWLTQTQGGSLPGDHPAHDVLFVLASMDDPGCLILPYHRVLADVEAETVLEAWREGAETSRVSEADLRLYDGRTDREIPLRFTSRNKLTTLEPEQCEAWHHLDYAYLHRYLIDELLTKRLGAPPNVHYVKSDAEARGTARRRSGIALLTKAVSLASLRAISEAGLLMPQKSTCFHPKLATGMTIYPLS